MYGRVGRFSGSWFLLLALLLQSACAVTKPDTQRHLVPSDVNEVEAYFRNTGKKVLTFIGYSGAGYEDEARMLRDAKRVMDEHPPSRYVINIGATPDGIGAVYPLAKQMGYLTTGIVSSQATDQKAEFSPYVDRIFVIRDDLWGGFKNRKTHESHTPEQLEKAHVTELMDWTGLSPTSATMVGVSDVIVGIGGGAVGRDELAVASRAKKLKQFFPAEMNHIKSIEAARKKGLSPPVDFSGAASKFSAKSQ